MKPKQATGAPDQGKAAVTMNELGHLASGVGHHVINAFSAIVSNAEILRLKLSMPDAPDPTAMADTIIRTAVEASGVARRLIDVSRPLTKVGDDEIDVDAMIVDYVDAKAAASDGRVRWSATPGAVPPILGNIAHLRGMLDLLTTNAIEAARPSGVEINLATSLDGRGWVVIEVRDTGTGMPSEVLERAVEPFFSTRPAHIGVGLSIANGIWRRHKGTLSVRSVPEEGTTIRLCVEPARIPAPPA